MEESQDNPEQNAQNNPQQASSSNPETPPQESQLEFKSRIDLKDLRQAVEKIKTELGEKKFEKDSEKTVISEALKKRVELIKSYKKEGSNINPLVLIQLPDRKGQREDELKDKVIKILKDDFNISTEKGNNKLAIWLSGEHVNKEDVEKNDSEVEVLIFKQAIALGWDCPRAQVMALFREWHSPVFSIQTVGRIMRMPELKHYTKN